jgi:hypothetical protein
MRKKKKKDKNTHRKIIDFRSISTESCLRTQFGPHIVKLGQFSRKSRRLKRSSNVPRANVPTDIPTRLVSRNDEHIWRLLLLGMAHVAKHVQSTRHEIK